MNMKFINKIDPRLAIMILLALAFVGTLGTMTYGFMLSSRVDLLLAQADKTFAEATSGTLTRVADKPTSATQTRDAATSGSTRSIASTTSGTRGASGIATASRTAMREGRMTSGSRTAMNVPTSGSRTMRADRMSSRTVAMAGRPGPNEMGRNGMRGRNPRGGPGGPQTAASSLPTTVTQMIETKGLFGRKPQVQQSCSLQGILGQSALINGQWIKVGETQGSVKLLELYPNKAVVEFEGSRRELTIWSDMPQG